MNFPPLAHVLPKLINILVEYVQITELLTQGPRNTSAIVDGEPKSYRIENQRDFFDNDPHLLQTIERKNNTYNYIYDYGFEFYKV